MRRYKLNQRPVPKGMAYPLRRCSLDAAFEVGDVESVTEVSFRNWPSRPLIEAIFQGAGRRNPRAGLCTVEIGAVPSRTSAEIETLLLTQGIPRFLGWLRETEKLAQRQPLDIFRWSASIEGGQLVVHE
jgi:hypothetical protein